MNDFSPCSRKYEILDRHSLLPDGALAIDDTDCVALQYSDMKDRSSQTLLRAYHRDLRLNQSFGAIPILKQSY